MYLQSQLDHFATAKFSQIQRQSTQLNKTFKISGRRTLQLKRKSISKFWWVIYNESRHIWIRQYCCIASASAGNVIYQRSEHQKFVKSGWSYKAGVIYHPTVSTKFWKIGFLLSYNVERPLILKGYGILTEPARGVPCMVPTGGQKRVLSFLLGGPNHSNRHTQGLPLNGGCVVQQYASGYVSRLVVLIWIYQCL